MNIFIWMNYPSHHQSHFFDTLIKLNVNLKVGYYAQITDDRKDLGWDVNTLKPFECHVTEAQIDNFVSHYSDYVHIVPGYGSRFTRKLAIQLSKKSINWVHWSEKSTPGIWWYKSFLIKKWYSNLVNKFALGTLAQGVLAEKDFRRWGIKKDIKHLSYSIKPLIFHEKNKSITEFKGNRFAFLYLGQLINRKGIDLLLKAFSEIRNNKWCLIIVGNGSAETKLKNLANKLNIKSDRLLFHPAVSSKDISSVISAADVFLLPSRNDGWGVVLNEAASLNKPIIASDMVGAAWHLIENGKNGYRFTSNDYNDLKIKMEFYTESESLIHEHSLYSRILFDRYNSETMGKNLISYLNIWLDSNENND